jgi:hypothetical protein
VDNIKMNFRETGWGGMDGMNWIGLAQGSNQQCFCEQGIEPLGSIKCWEVIG